MDVAEGAAVELARQDRIETFRRWIAFDAEIAAARQALYLARVGWQTERLQLNALHLALQDRINVREQEDNSRTLLVQVDREIRRTEPLNLTLEFSRDVDQVRVLLAGQMLEPAGGYFDLATTLTPEALESLPDLGRLRITAQDLLSATSIDRNPATRPYLGPEADWLGIEPGADTHHILKLDDGLLVAGDLEGIWAGTGYTCGGAVPDQILEVTADGENLTATKLVGDTCITAGEVSWMGRFDQNRFPVRFHVSDLDGSNKRWLNREIKPINRDTLQGMGITFRRLRN